MSKLIYHVINIAFVIINFFIVVKCDNNIYPSPNEIILAEKSIGSLKIERLEDLVSIQNRVFDKIKHSIPAFRLYPLDVTYAMDNEWDFVMTEAYFFRKYF